MSGDEAEIKKLQGQLVKCGVRKIWGIELRAHGDDSRAKIRHLRGMLADAGMTGRFSEARAREIKERRELLADLEAVSEMNNLWGSAAARGRSSRSRTAAAPPSSETNNKKTKAAAAAASDDEDNDDDEGAENAEDDEEVEGNGTAKARVSKRMADLAFLGDESESE